MAGEPLDIGAIPGELGVIPIKNAVLFPAGTLPLALSLNTSQVVDEAVEGFVVTVLPRDAPRDPVAGGELFEIGTLCSVVKIDRSSEPHSVVVQGIARCRLRDVSPTAPFRARVEVIPDEGVLDEKTVDRIRILGIQIIHRSPGLPHQARALARDIVHPSHLIDWLVANLAANEQDKQRCLETPALVERAALAAILLTAVLEQLPAPASTDTQCVLHGIPAEGTCARCGGFICGACRGVGGTSELCGTCRARQGPGTTPMPDAVGASAAGSLGFGLIALLLWSFVGFQSTGVLFMLALIGLGAGGFAQWQASKLLVWRTKAAAVLMAATGMVSSAFVIAQILRSWAGWLLGR